MEITFLTSINQARVDLSRANVNLKRLNRRPPGVVLA